LLQGKAPITVFCGLPPALPLDGIRDPTTFTLVSYDDFMATRYDGLDAAHSAFANMHRDLAAHKAKVRQQKRDAADRGNKAKPREFAIGDFVLVHSKRPSLPKPSFKWDGPWVVIGTKTPWVYTIEEVQSKKLHDCHVWRMRLYNNATKELSNEVLEAIKFSEVGNEIEQFSNFRVNPATGVMELESVWLGTDGEKIWKPVSTLYEDVFQMYKAYMISQLAQLDPTSPAYEIATAIVTAYPINTGAVANTPKPSTSAKKSKAKKCIEHPTSAPAKAKDSKKKVSTAPVLLASTRAATRSGRSSATAAP